MYDISKRKCSNDLTVAELLDIIASFPNDAKVLCCGNSKFYVHVNHGESIISIDTEDLDSEYNEYAAATPEKYFDNRDMSLSNF